jgi:deoxycytidine triphosphate deaminase
MKHILGPNSKSLLTGVQEGDSQPNAVDLRIDKVFKISGGDFILSNEEKIHRGSTILNTFNDYFELSVGSYEVIFENVINVGEGEAGWVITRSTLNRNGCFLTSGLYDSGYNGLMAGVLHVTCGHARIKRGTRIGQYLSFDAEALTMYDGDYGLNKAHDTKYENS